MTIHFGLFKSINRRLPNQQPQYLYGTAHARVGKICNNLLTISLSLSSFGTKAKPKHDEGLLIPGPARTTNGCPCQLISRTCVPPWRRSPTWSTTAARTTAGGQKSWQTRPWPRTWRPRSISMPEKTWPSSTFS